MLDDILMLLYVYGSVVVFLVSIILALLLDWHREWKKARIASEASNR